MKKPTILNKISIFKSKPGKSIQAESNLTHPKYRADIDGLRAIAILSVVGFHAFPNLIRGGFIGVDIFFVISGFLISTILFENLERNTFSFTQFYTRRIKRIFPGLILVLASCQLFGWFTLLTSEYKQLGKHIAGGSGFISNFILWNESGYFDNSSETKPLLHLWSLSIEEQFYIIWPLLLWCAWKKNFNLLKITIIIAILSFVLNIKAIHTDRVAAFYSPQTRFWELLFGSIVAWLTLYKRNTLYETDDKPNNINNRSNLITKNLQSILGIILLAYGICRITKNSHFPGTLALIPTIGTILVISAGSKAWINRTILSNKILVWFGLISFPLYLWHWPLLSFARIIKNEPPSISTSITAIIISVLLAWLTYRLLERPIRSNKNNKIKVLFLLFTLIIIGGIGYDSYIKDRTNSKNKDKQEFFEYFENSIPEWRFYNRFHILEAYREECNFYNSDAYRNGKATEIPRVEIDKSCYTKDKKKSKSIFIWGDSHAQQLNYGLRKRLPANWQILQVASSGCHANVGPFSDPETNYCDKSNLFALNSIKLNKPDIVIIGQNDKHNTIIAEKINQNLKEMGVSKVIFLGPVPHWKSDLPKIIVRQLWNNTPERTFTGIDKEYFDQNDKLKKDYLAKKLNYIDAISLFCNESGCLTRIGSDRLSGIITHDYGHLLPIASDYLASKLLVTAINNP